MATSRPQHLSASLKPLQEPVAGPSRTTPNPPPPSRVSPAALDTTKELEGNDSAFSGADTVDSPTLVRRHSFHASPPPTGESEPLPAGAAGPSAAELTGSPLEALSSLRLTDSEPSPGLTSSPSPPSATRHAGPYTPAASAPPFVGVGFNGTDYSQDGGTIYAQSQGMYNPYVGARWGTMAMNPYGAAGIGAAAPGSGERRSGKCKFFSREKVSS